MNKIIKTEDFWVGFSVLVVGAVGLYGSSQIYRAESLIGVLGPRVFPGVLCLGLLTLGGILIFRSIRSDEAKVDIGNIKLLSIIGVITLVYLLLFETLGYLLSNILFLGILFRLLGVRRLWMAGVVAVIVSCLLYVGFGEGLKVTLPKGLYGF